MGIEEDYAKGIKNATGNAKAMLMKDGSIKKDTFTPLKTRKATPQDAAFKKGGKVSGVVARGKMDGTKLKSGGKCVKLAMGGAGKIRKGQAKAKRK